MSNVKISHGIYLTLLAIVFTIGLTFISVELPRVVDSFLDQNIDFPNIATGLDAENEYKTDLYIKHNHLQLIGYSCFILIIILIIVGFITNKSGMSSVGAIFLFLPVFGHFALTMFFLGGLGFVRLIWLPFFDIPFDIFRLGDIVYLPYRLIVDLFSWMGISIKAELPYVITGTGLLLFMLGTLAWFYSKMRKEGVADFWLYRISRHPQYLGWIIWSYGIMFLERPNIKQMYEISNSLPWLLMTMVIIGVSLLEELKMRRKQGEKYDAFCRQTPFLFPLPNIVAKIFTAPLKVIFRKDSFERKKEIIFVLIFYTIVCMTISVFYAGLISQSTQEVQVSEHNIEKFVDNVRNSDNWGDTRSALNSLASIGEPAVESLLVFLQDVNHRIRWYAADAAGNITSDRIVESLIELLYDENRNVRRVAAGSLGKIGSKRAVKPLINVLQDRTMDNAGAAARALGQIGSPEAIKPLINALLDTTRAATGSAAEALGQLEAKEAIDPLIHCLEKMKDYPYHKVGQALNKLQSDRAIDAFIAGVNRGTMWVRKFCTSELGQYKSEKAIKTLISALKDELEIVRRAAVLSLMEINSAKATEALTDALNDEDLEVRMYAKEALTKINNQ